MEEVIINCPFCNERTIKCNHRPRAKYFRRARGSSTTKSMVFYHDEKYTVIISKCPNCGKTKKEIEDRLKHGKRPSREEIIKRAREAGLPLRF